MTMKKAAKAKYADITNLNSAKRRASNNTT